MYEDDPQEKVFDVLGQAVFGDHPLGRAIIGRAQVIADIPVSEIASFHAVRYRPSNVVIAAAGAVDHDQLVALAAERVPDALVPSALAEIDPPTPSAPVAACSSARTPSSTTCASAVQGSRDTMTVALPSGCSTRSSAAHPPRGCSRRFASAAVSPTPSTRLPAAIRTAARSVSMWGPVRTTSPRRCWSSLPSSTACATSRPRMTSWRARRRTSKGASSSRSNRRAPG